MNYTIVKPSVSFLPQDMENTRRIEYCGRTCYDSRDKITDVSALPFIENIIKRGHESVLEHSNIVIRTENDYSTRQMAYIVREAQMRHGLPVPIYNDSSDNQFTLYSDNIFSGNVRAWRTVAKYFCGEELLQLLFWKHPLFFDIFKDHPYEPDLDDNGEPLFLATIIPEDPRHRDIHTIVTVDIVCDRGVSHELVRHRSMSFSQQSTRYVSYANGLKFVEPWWWEKGGYPTQELKEVFEAQCRSTATAYRAMFDAYGSPQLARGVLPNALATEICVTGRVNAWKDFFALRCDKAAHPDMRRVAEMILEKFPDTQEVF